MPHKASSISVPRRAAFLLLLAGLLCLVSLPNRLFNSLQPAARAASTFSVNSTGDAADSNTADGVCDDGAGHCTLRAAIEQANGKVGADTINFSVTGTINLTGALPDINSEINIKGPGSSLLTVRRDTGGDYRIFSVNNVTVSISGLTVTNGKLPDGASVEQGAGGNANNGGGIRQSGGFMTLTDVVITGNRTGNGGSSSSSVGGSGGSGGGIAAGGTLTMTNVVVTGNATGVGGTGNNGGGHGGDGGGVWFSGTALTMNNVTVTGNTTGDGEDGGEGGGIYVAENAAATISDCTISDNGTGRGGTIEAAEGGYGGGIFNIGTTSMTRCLVSGNTTKGSVTFPQGSAIGGGGGGGVFNYNKLTMTNCTVSSNHATPDTGMGGGIFNLGDSLTLTNVTVTANSGAPDSPGVYNSRVANVGNTIIAGNGNGSAPDAVGTFNSRGHNLIGRVVTLTGFTAAGDQVGTTDAPVNALLGPLADNGGPTMTHALLAGSPALDAGDNALARDTDNNVLTTDQRGAGRYAGASRITDIGAYEFHPSLEDVPSQVTNEDVPITLRFDVGDGAADITSVTASSGNQALVPDVGLSISGDGPVRTLQVTPAANQSGAADITLTVTHSDSHVSSDTFALTVNPVNDAPSFTKGADQTVAEDSGAQTVVNWATDISAGPGESSQSVFFVVTGNSVPGLFSSAPAVSPSGTLTFTPAPNASGSATISLVARDNGGTSGLGQDTSAAQTFTITVTPVNDPPVAQNQVVNTLEDSPRFISLPASDIDGDGPLTYSILSGPSHGTLSGTGSGRTYTPAANYNSTDSFTFKVSDPSGAESAPATVTITITAINDAPVNTVPGPQATDQNAPLVFSPGNSNALSVADVDAGTDPLRVTLAAAHGTLTLGATAGLTFVAGDGTNDVTMTFSGAAEEINTSLVGLTFKPDAGYSGDASLQVSTTDQGFNGAGGARDDTDSVSITVRPGTVEFSQSVFTAGEGEGSLAVTVRRTGDTSQAASVAYATDDGSVSGVSVPCSATTGAALDRCDFTKAVGRLSFAPGETEKAILILLTDDSYVEGTETALIRLDDPVGGPVLGQRAVATIEIRDGVQEPLSNPADDTQFFVRQHYHDFLNREPDADGFRFWTDEIEQCGADPGCREVKRINVSAAFFLSIEFQETGYLVYRVYKSAYGDATSPNVEGTVPVIRLSEFLPDAQRIGQGVRVNVGDWEQQLEANKQAYMLDFVRRQRFADAFPASMTVEQFVEKLNRNAGGALSQAERDRIIAELAAAPDQTQGRASALRKVAEDADLRNNEKSRAFVLMEYFGYLRRNPDDPPDTDFRGWKFWLSKLEQFNGNYVEAEMVKAFISSDEYRKRFGQ